MTDIQGLCVIILLSMLQIPLWAIYDQLNALVHLTRTQKKNS